MMKLFLTVVNGFQPLTVCAKNFIICCSKYSTMDRVKFVENIKKFEMIWSTLADLVCLSYVDFQLSEPNQIY